MGLVEMPVKSAVTLKSRKDFLRVRDGRKWAARNLVLQARRQSPDIEGGPKDDTGMAPQPDAAPRFGFTITKKVGQAVVRNRIRRRLKAAVRHLAQDHAKPGYDYVLIGRRSALHCAFADILEDLRTAFSRVHGRKDVKRDG